ncbi:MAG: hypothetical protein V5A41_09505 [Haloarculaceae archaeon]
MRRSSDRGQVEPLAALAAVLAVSAGLVVYAETLDDTVPGQPDDETPTAILDSVHRSLQTTGVSTPSRLDTAMATVPEGWQVNVTLTADSERWQRGPSPPESADRVTRRVSVRLAPQRIEPGQLRVVVWR